MKWFPRRWPYFAVGFDRGEFWLYLWFVEVDVWVVLIMNTEQERTEFETWYRLHHGSRDVYGRDVSGEYVDKQVQGAFNVWQARAALAAQPAAATKAPGDEGAAGIMPRPIVTDAQR